MWSGKQIFSLYLPKTLNYSLKANICQGCTKCEEEECKHDAYVVVKNGQLVSGVIDRRSIGSEQSESLLHRIIKDYGTQAGREFLNKVTHLLKQFISMRGFRVIHTTNWSSRQSTQPNGKNNGSHPKEN